MNVNTFTNYPYPGSSVKRDEVASSPFRSFARSKTEPKGVDPTRGLRGHSLIVLAAAIAAVPLRAPAHDGPPQYFGVARARASALVVTLRIPSPADLAALRGIAPAGAGSAAALGPSIQRVFGFTDGGVDWWGEGFSIGSEAWGAAGTRLGPGDEPLRTLCASARCPEQRRRSGAEAEVDRFASARASVVESATTVPVATASDVVEEGLLVTLASVVDGAGLDAARGVLDLVGSSLDTHVIGPADALLAQARRHLPSDVDRELGPIPSPDLGSAPLVWSEAVRSSTDVSAVNDPRLSARAQATIASTRLLGLVSVVSSPAVADVTASERDAHATVAGGSTEIRVDLLDALQQRIDVLRTVGDEQLGTVPETVPVEPIDQIASGLEELIGIARRMIDIRYVEGQTRSAAHPRAYAAYAIAEPSHFAVELWIPDPRSTAIGGGPVPRVERYLPTGSSVGMTLPGASASVGLGAIH